MNQRWIRQGAWIGALILAVCAGCSDDEPSNPLGDGAATADTGPTPDGGQPVTDGSASGDVSINPTSDATPDVTSQADAANPPADAQGSQGDGNWTGTLSCGELIDCVKNCKGDILTCGENECGPKACPSAEDPVDDIIDCLQDNCLLICIGGINQACENCAKTQCTSEYNACLAHKCQ